MRDSSGQNVDFFRMDGNTENRERLRKNYEEFALAED